MGDIFTPLGSLRKALEKYQQTISSALYGDGWTLKTDENGSLSFSASAIETTAEPVEESEQEQEQKKYDYRNVSEWRHIEGNIYECKKCLITTQVDENFGSPAYKFCPYCGAEMIIYNL